MDAEAKAQLEADIAFEEGVAEATVLYEAKVVKIRDQSWDLGLLAALKEAVVPEDHPAHKNPAKFPGLKLD